MIKVGRKLRLLVTVVLVVALSLSVLVWVRHTTDAVRAEARQRFFEQYNRQQYLMAELASRTLEELFGNCHHSLDVLVSCFEKHDVTRARVAEVEPTIRKIYRTLSDALVMDLTVFDRNGRAVTTLPADVYTSTHDFSWREYFRWARDTKAKGAMYLSSFQRLHGGRFRGDMGLIVAEGIYGPDNEFRGVAILSLNFDDLLRRTIGSIHIGKSGRAWLVDNNNHTVLVDQNGRLTGKDFDAVRKWPTLHQMLVASGDGKPGSGRYRYEDPDDPNRRIWKLGSYHPVRIGNGRLWTLGISTPEREMETQLAAFLDRQEDFATTMVAAVMLFAIATLGLLFNWNRMLSVQVEMRTRDLDEARTRLESTFDELLVTKKVAAVGRLALGMVHEVRNPLSAIQMNMQMIRKRIGPSGNLRENFEIVEGEIQRLNGILNDVLNFARSRPLRLEETDLQGILERPLRLLSQRFQEQGICYELRVDEPVPLVCDPEQIHQVLLNLLLNAAEAMENLPERYLLVHAIKRHRTTQIKVTDTGVGIAPEKRDQLFDLFYTSKAAGGGLGLSIVQTIVLRHGGSIGIESEPGKGATFTVTLPLRGPSPQE